MGITALLRDWLVKDFDPATTALYTRCVAAARQPAFYALYRVPDSVDGRFDLLLLHVFLLLRRMTDADAKQRLFDFMFADMDRSLREMGVGDMSIGKKMKPMLEGFYGRAAVYEKALAETNDEALILALSRNLYGGTSDRVPEAGAVADYIRAAVATLATQNEDDMLRGICRFPALN